MSNAKLIKALRCKSNDINDCATCDYYNACYGGTLEEIAADALEAAEQRIAELESWAIHLLKQLPKEGEWIEVHDWLHIPQEERGTYRCSACGQVMKYPWNYCPSCGAKMRKGDK